MMDKLRYQHTDVEENVHSMVNNLNHVAWNFTDNSIGLLEYKGPLALINSPSDNRIINNLTALNDRYKQILEDQQKQLADLQQKFRLIEEYLEMQEDAEKALRKMVVLNCAYDKKYQVRLHKLRILSIFRDHITGHKPENNIILPTNTEKKERVMEEGTNPYKAFSENIGDASYASNYWGQLMRNFDKASQNPTEEQKPLLELFMSLDDQGRKDKQKEFKEQKGKAYNLLPPLVPHK